MPIFVQSNTDGFRRCGVAHTREGQEFADDFFTKNQIKILNDDPDIMIVAGVADDDEGGDEGGDGNVILPPLEEGAARKVLEKMNNDKLKSDCDWLEIEYPANALKADLVELILKNTAPDPEV